MSIRKFCILGERCSGTHFLQHAIQYNFSGLEYERKSKHFFGHHDNTDYVEANDTLYLAIVRDPVSWLDSFFRQPYHVEPSLTTSWQTFLTKEWHSFVDFDEFDESRWGQELMEDRSFVSKEPYRDVFALRQTKCFYLLDSLPLLAPHCMVIRYEDLRDKYDSVMSNICKQFGLQVNAEVGVKGEWIPVLHYKDLYQEKFQEREIYMPMEWRDWVWFHVDKEQEERMGYKKDCRNL